MFVVAVPGVVAEESAVVEPTTQATSASSARVSALRYDQDYPTINYSGQARHNDVARLQERLQSGEVKLEYHPVRGYLDSTLKELGIDPSSQILVYSKTSLQIAGIRAATPRALYFNDTTYVGWVQRTDMLEIVTMDDKLGPVFYSMPNSNAQSRQSFDREFARCLGCHDKFALSGGGVPLLMAISAPVDLNGLRIGNQSVDQVIDKTPFDLRWGGWYVTGQHGSQVHLGNLQLNGPADLANLEQHRGSNLDSLSHLFDTRPYMTDKSDVVALLVFEHQTYIQNMITRVSYKAQTFVAKESPSGNLDEVSPKTQQLLTRMMEPLVQALLFVDAAPLTDKVVSGSGFDRWFEARGPRDPQGRSLRELELNSRLFKYPVSFLVHSDAFLALPDYVKSYVYRRFDEIFSGQDRTRHYHHISDADRQAAHEILTATLPEFAEFVAQR